MAGIMSIADRLRSVIDRQPLATSIQLPPAFAAEILCSVEQQENGLPTDRLPHRDPEAQRDRWSCGLEARRAEIALHLIQSCGISDIRAMEYLGNLIDDAGPRRTDGLLMHEQVPF